MPAVLPVGTRSPKPRRKLWPAAPRFLHRCGTAETQRGRAATKTERGCPQPQRVRRREVEVNSGALDPAGVLRLGTAALRHFRKILAAREDSARLQCEEEKQAPPEAKLSQSLTRPAAQSTPRDT